MLSTSLGAKPLKPASKNKTIDQSFVYYQDNIIENWKYSALMFRNLGGQRERSFKSFAVLQKPMVCFGVQNTILSILELLTPSIRHLPCFSAYIYPVSIRPVLCRVLLSRLVLIDFSPHFFLSFLGGSIAGCFRSRGSINCRPSMGDAGRPGTETQPAPAAPTELGSRMVCSRTHATGHGAGNDPILKVW